MTKNNSNFGEPGKVLETSGLEKINWKEPTWLEIEEEFRNKFYQYRMNEKWDTEEDKDRVLVEEHGADILKFFKPYFQEKMHEEAVDELEIVDNNPKE